MNKVKKLFLLTIVMTIMIFQGIPGTDINWAIVSNAGDYSDNGCVRWVKDRAAQIGITLPSTGKNEYGLYGASAYWSTLSNYPHGSEPAPNALAVWKFNNGSDGQGGKYGHVAFVESVNGNNVTVTEGGCRGYSYNGHTGVICRTKSKDEMASLGGCSGFYGYIYLSGAPHTHSYSASVTTQPTCTATGVRTYSCSCGSSYTESIPAKGHSYRNQVVAPTLTEKGYTLHACSVCGNSYKDSYVNPPELKSDGWYYCATVPNGITSDKYTIEYENYYEKIQATSPGSDWTNVATVKNEWQNSGGQYTSETDLPTSDSRVLVRSVYYHFCGPNAGASSNYELAGNFVHYDEIVVGVYGVIPYYKGLDNGHPWYLLDWNDGGGRVYCASGTTCDGSYGTHGERNCTWYKMNTYQDRVHVVQYKFTKNSGWVNTKDPSATSVKIRFKSIATKPEPETPSEPEKEEPEAPEPGKPEEPEKEEPETPESEIPAAPENPDEPESGTSDDYHFSVKLSNGKLYFTWDAINPKAIYAVEYSIIPTAGFLEECFYDVVPAQDDKMCYATNALPYRENWQIYFRLKIKCSYDDTNPVYSEVFEFNWPTHKVTFMNGNTIVSEQEVYEGENASAPSLKQDGYELSWNGKYTNVVSDVTVYAVWTKKESVPDSSTDKKTDFEKDSAEADDSTNSTVQKILNEDTDASYEVPKPKKVTSLSVKNTKTKKLSISWKKQNSVDGYQVQIATKKNFKAGKKTKTAYSNKLTWTGLKKGKTYYIRVRGYNYDENDCKQYGAWSTVKSVKVRK